MNIPETLSAFHDRQLQPAEQPLVLGEEERVEGRCFCDL